MQKFIHAAEKNGQLAKNARNYLWKNPETACLDALDMDKDAVSYNEDGTVTLDFVK